MDASISANGASGLPSWSEAATSWLRIVLEERYGLSFGLDVTEGAWCLSLPGSKDVIRITTNPSVFVCAHLDMPCADWDAASEGWQPVLGSPVPAPGAAALPLPLVERTSDGYCVRYDILGLVYWALTRQEEVGHSDLDEHGRFSAISSHAFKYGYLERPVVDEWLDVLKQVICRLWPTATLTEHIFKVYPSHDVDAPSRYGFSPWRALPRSMAADILKYRDLRGVLAPWLRLRTYRRLHPADAYNTFDWLMDVSERHNQVSAFYFICDRRGRAHDCDYDLEHPAIRDLIRRIHARGHEVGLHPSYGTYLEPVQIKHEADHLRRVCKDIGVRQAQWGGRMHYLQWQQPTTMRAWNDAGMAYDSTLTYADHVGFRCGTCFDYPAFDPVAQEMLQLRIRPLIVMEGSVFGAKYMNLGVTDAACDKILQLKQTCRSVAGSFTLLWHNSSFQTRLEKRIYEAILNG